MKEISSFQNPRIKHIVKLNNRRYRDEQNQFIIEGYRPLLKAIQNDYPVSELYICPELFLGPNEETLLIEIEKKNIPLFTVTEGPFRKIAYRHRPEGLLAIAPQQKIHLKDCEAVEKGFYCIIEAIEKPGNLGSILRSADAAGVHGLILCDLCTDIFNPNVVRSSIGTLFSVPLYLSEPEHAFQWCRNNNISVIASSPHTDRLFTSADYTHGTAIVAGSEQYGLSDFWLEHADSTVAIPMLGQADSLNVATATTLLLYEVVRQRLAES